MTNGPNNPNSSNKGFFLGYVILAVYLCIIALRTTLTESPSIQPDQPINLNNSIYSLSVSALLIILFALWLISAACSKKFTYCPTGTGIGLCIFTAAAFIAGLAAPDKRSAISDFLMLSAPPICALALVQILDSRLKIKLLLCVIAALGIVSAYQCAEQLFFSNQITIEQYKENPQAVLDTIGIKPGSFNQMLFEHRLYTKGVRGFFTTSNSAGSFAILACFAAIALFIEKLKNHKQNLKKLITCGLAAAIIFFGLAITESKGAIIAFLISAAMFAVYVLFGKWVNANKGKIFATSLLLLFVFGWAIVRYGLNHNRLPGGNSMLVRWQYWQAASQMSADHWLKGVGPGNFALFYTQYKIPAALETITDPHNFLLSILTQYGPLGLIGFLVMLALPMWKATTSAQTNFPQPQQKFGQLAFILLSIIAAVMLFVRPVIMPLNGGDTIGVIAYVIFVLYVTPVIVFTISCWLLGVNEKNSDSAPTNLTIAALWCAVIGVLIHNTIDFAIFEPGVWTSLWAIIACLIALHRRRKPISIPPISTKVFITAAGLILIWACLNYTLVPVIKSTIKIRQAQQAASENQFERTHKLLEAAANDDRLSAAALSLNSKLYLRQFHDSDSKQTALLLNAEICSLAAIKRNMVDFKNFEQLAGIYSAMAEITGPQEKQNWLSKAFDLASQAVELYPGSCRLHFRLAEIAEQLGKNDIAVENYKKAVEIEDSYREQFKTMYPGREIFSRLGEEKYKTAKQKIEILKNMKNSIL